MKQHEFLQGESVITQSDQNIVTLTSKRIRYESKEFGKAYVSEIMLENIACVSARYSSSLILLVLGILSLLVGVFFASSSYDESDTGIGVAIAVVGAILVILYFSSRKYLLTVYSKGDGKINFEAKGLKMEDVVDFINKVSRAIDQRSKNLE